MTFNDLAANTNNNSNNNQRINFFALKNDGDSAIVRILHDDIASLTAHTVHSVSVDGRKRNVNCFRNPGQPSEVCPFCEAGYNVYTKFYVKMIQYTQDTSGNIVANPVIWDRSAAYVRILKNLIDEYGPLSDCIFKIVRNGAAGDMGTTYSIFYGNPKIYPDNLYVKSADIFNTFDPNKVYIMNKSVDDMRYYLANNAFPAKPQVNSDQNVSSNTNSVANVSVTVDTAPAMNTMNQSFNHVVNNSFENTSTPSPTNNGFENRSFTTQPANKVSNNVPFKPDTQKPISRPTRFF